jgi:acyl-coenzyme A thioesterase PaaI-like protein
MTPRAVNTHLGLDRALCGEPVVLEPGRATARFVATQVMAADDAGLVHGGFVFGLADHAAMLAVNDPNVVLGAADVRFLAPVRVGDVVVASAEVKGEKGRKREVVVEARVPGVGDDPAGLLVLAGTLTAFVLDDHVLSGRPA